MGKTSGPVFQTLEQFKNFWRRRLCMWEAFPESRTFVIGKTGERNIVWRGGARLPHFSEVNQAVLQQAGASVFVDLLWSPRPAFHF